MVGSLCLEHAFYRFERNLMCIRGVGLTAQRVSISVAASLRRTTEAWESVLLVTLADFHRWSPAHSALHLSNSNSSCRITAATQTRKEVCTRGEAEKWDSSDTAAG